MRNSLILLLPVLICVNSASETPIVGILAQEKYIVANVIPEEYDSFIAASYVKYLESAGARVIPVWIGQTEDYYERVVKYTNGVLFPGGGTFFNESGGYGEAARQIYKLAKETNERGVHYPLWGTCLGLQVMFFSDVGTDIRITCSLKNVALPLKFVEGFRSSRLFTKASDDIIQILKTQNVTYNFHGYCITDEVLKEHGIAGNWNAVSHNSDTSGLEYISSVEHKNYPIYGVQFHPEKNPFEFRERSDIPHSPDATKIAQYFSNFFVGETRKNNHSFPSSGVEMDSLIYNFNPIFTGKMNSTYEQTYVFRKSDYERINLT